MKAAFLASAVLAAASIVFYFGTAANTAKASGSRSAEPGPAASKTLASKAMSLPMFFEPNQGQTAPQVKFLARGPGYGLFLTAGEAVLELHRSAAGTQHSASSQTSALSSQPAASSVIRMRLAGANASPRVSGASPLPGKSSYYIGNDPAKWHRDIPQFARVEYSGVYPGVDLVYYGNQGQLEYDFRVAPAADPSQIALSFDGASAQIASGDLVLSTSSGDVRFHAPVVYQQDGNTQKPVAGGFRQLADNKIGFTVGPYDHSRELVIDPVLSYSTYLGGGGESVAYVAVGPDNNVYLAGSTKSANFPTVSPYQACLDGAKPTGNPPVCPPPTGNPTPTNIFIAEMSPDLSTLLYATYLGGSGTDTAAGISVGTAMNGINGGQPAGYDVYVAGSTTSTNFPTSGTGGTIEPFQYGPPTQAGTHGFVSRLNIDISSITNTTTSTLFYSTYLAGNGTDTVTGLAIDGSGDAFVTGVTTSSNSESSTLPFPASPNGYQTASNSPGNPQFFASKILTTVNGVAGMIYSTYFGGGIFPPTLNYSANTGGGIAVDTAGNMYFTGTTNMLPGTTSTLGFPLQNAQQSCLNDPGVVAPNCSSTDSNSGDTDAFVAKINPTYSSTSSLIYSTYIGGSSNDVGNAIAIDTSSNAYVTGSTNSSDWVCTSCNGFQTTSGVTGATNAFIAKIGNLTSTGDVYPLTYFTYIGGSGPDVGNAIVVDTQQAAHVTGSTESSNPSIAYNPICPPNTQGCIYNGDIYGGGQSDAFVALIGTTLSGQGAGDYVTYLGGSAADQGTGIALATDGSGSTYVAGTTISANFPITSNAYQPCLDEPGTPLANCTAPTQPAQNAFVSKIGPNINIQVTKPTTGPSPNPVAAGTPINFTFYVYNLGPDNAVNVTFDAIVSVSPTSTSGLSTSIATITNGGGGACLPAQEDGTYIACSIPTLTACTTTASSCTTFATVQVTVTANPTATPSVGSITVNGQAGTNGGLPVSSTSQTVNVNDFKISAPGGTTTVVAGTPATIQVLFCPSNPTLGYSGTITPSDTISNGMVTKPSPTFNPTTVTLSGSGCQTTWLTIPTVAPPVTTVSLFRRGSFYAAWLPIGGLSLVGLGIGAGRKRRRWLAGLALGLIAGAILLQPACGGASTPNPTTGGTQPGTYTVTITGTAGTGAVHTAIVTVTVT